jgi:hypothetical protein
MIQQEGNNNMPKTKKQNKSKADAAPKSPSSSPKSEAKKAPSEKSSAPAPAPATGEATVRVLRAGEAPKLSGRSPGAIGYEVGEDAATGEAKLRLTRNDGGGTFSKEWVSLVRIAETVAEPDKAGRSFHATRLRPAFNGRSTNNAPFLAAALVAEGLLAKSDEEGRKVMLRVARAPEAWSDLLRGRGKASSAKGPSASKKTSDQLEEVAGDGEEEDRGGEAPEEEAPEEEA